MKANELMIGDWILMNGHKVRVTKLTAGKDYDNCEGVPLTAEILEKNGWHNDRSGLFDEVVYCVGISGSKKEVRVHFDTNYVGYFLFVYDGRTCPISCKFVHELQHALRLCGLNELAENFKID